MLMFKDILIFLIIWVFVLSCFALIGNLTFGDVPELMKLVESYLYFIETSFGNVNFSVFDVYLEFEP